MSLIDTDEKKEYYLNIYRKLSKKGKNMLDNFSHIGDIKELTTYCKEVLSKEGYSDKREGFLTDEEFTQNLGE
tara:strand:+ start:339 stop:557 length:219 start_codon:yes stop_codon:yes gene_type:complete